MMVRADRVWMKLEQIPSYQNCRDCRIHLYITLRPSGACFYVHIVYFNYEA